MIRKVPNMHAWIIYAKDYSNWTNTIRRFHNILRLPLFELNPNTPYGSIDRNDLILVVDTSIHNVPFTFEQVEKINKYWDICMSKNLDYMNIKFK